MQEGFWEEHGLQCDYCTPGMMMAAIGLLADNPHPSEAEIRNSTASVGTSTIDRRLRKSWRKRPTTSRPNASSTTSADGSTFVARRSASRKPGPPSESGSTSSCHSGLAARASGLDRGCSLVGAQAAAKFLGSDEDTHHRSILARHPNDSFRRSSTSSSLCSKGSSSGSVRDPHPNC